LIADLGFGRRSRAGLARLRQSRLPIPPGNPDVLGKLGAAAGRIDPGSLVRAPNRRASFALRGINVDIYKVLKLV
jgi:hypothetical protein